MSALEPRYINDHPFLDVNGRGYAQGMCDHRHCRPDPGHVCPHTTCGGSVRQHLRMVLGDGSTVPVPR